MTATEIPKSEPGNRNRIIVRTSIIGILANVFLAAFKAVVGLTSNSIAIVMDAVNNISDAASSVITIIGTKLAGKEPDRKHPFGYGRTQASPPLWNPSGKSSGRIRRITARLRWLL